MSNVETDQILMRLGVAAAAVAAILPLYLIVFGTPLSASNPADFAQIHTAQAFYWRGLLTLLYFPAAICAHYALVTVFQPRMQSLALLGFAFFALGNGIDGCYRAVQFMLVHYSWGAQWLQASDAATREMLWQRVVGFSELAPAIQLSFAICFGIGRLLMGSAGLRGAGRMQALATLLLLLTGILNLLPWMGRLVGLDGLALPFSLYLWIWFFGLCAIAATLINHLYRSEVN